MRRQLYRSHIDVAVVVVLHITVMKNSFDSEGKGCSTL